MSVHKITEPRFMHSINRTPSEPCRVGTVQVIEVQGSASRGLTQVAREIWQISAGVIHLCQITWRGRHLAGGSTHPIRSGDRSSRRSVRLGVPRLHLNSQKKRKRSPPKLRTHCRLVERRICNRPLLKNGRMGGEGLSC
jgi:hypothetical protein